MGNDVTSFMFEGRPVRVVITTGEPEFVAKDAAEILGYANPQKAVRDHCKHAHPVGVNDSFTPLDPQTIVIPEGDLYRLVIRSNMPEAERFEAWVMDEVLPSIRKTGSYSSRPMSQPELALMHAQILVDQDRRLAAVESTMQTTQTAQAQQGQHLAVIGHRLDNLDLVNIVGDLRQRLEAMMVKYDRANGLQYGQGWKPFDRAFNFAFHANLTALRRNYAKREGLKKTPTRPAYFEAVGQLPDAVRIADKLLNTPADPLDDGAIQSRLDVN